jgi:hypothetical protein
LVPAHFGAREEAGTETVGVFGSRAVHPNNISALSRRRLWRAATQYQIGVKIRSGCLDYLLAASQQVLLHFGKRAHMTSHCVHNGECKSELGRRRVARETYNI